MLTSRIGHPSQRSDIIPLHLLSAPSLGGAKTPTAPADRVSPRGYGSTAFVPCHRSSLDLALSDRGYRRAQCEPIAGRSPQRGLLIGSLAVIMSHQQAFTGTVRQP